MKGILLLAFSLLVLNLVLHVSGTSVTVTAKRHSNNPSPTEFIKSSCKATRYPVVCVQSLLGFANVIRQSDRQLAITALSVSVSRTRSCGSFIKKMAKVKGMNPKGREYGAVRDCIENMDDSVDQLRQSVRELGVTRNNDLAWRVSNVQTWVSAALTHQETCLDGFSGYRVDGKLKSAIRQRVVDVSQVTSNALALVNRFATRHRAAAHTEN